MTPALRTRYAVEYVPTCTTCGQPMEEIQRRLFRCRNGLIVRRGSCPAPQQWEAPSSESRVDVLALCDALELAVTGRGPRRRGVSAGARTRDLFEEVPA